MNYLSFFDFRINGLSMNFTRIALAATVLSSKKSQDGISKLVFKSDFEKLKGKETTRKLDQMLSTMWPEALKVSKEVGYKTFGKACVNMILHLLQKEKIAKAAQYESFGAILQEFQDELAGKTAQVVQTPEVAAASSSDPIKNLVDCSAQEIAVLQNKHIIVGNKYLGSCLSFLACLQAVQDFFRTIPMAKVHTCRSWGQDLCADQA